MDPNLQASPYVLAREHLAPFGCLVDPGFQPSRFHFGICRALERAERGEILKLMLFAPPQHGKSTLASRFFPAWYAGRHPEQSILTASYNSDHAAYKGSKVRDLMRGERYKACFPTRIKWKTTASDAFEFTQGGEYHAFGIGGGGTGYSGNLIIIDDPVKGPEDANSKAVQTSHREWYDTVVSTREPPFGGRVIVLIMTRWNENDLAGQLLRDEPHDWHVECYPALNDRDEPLWPESPNQTFAKFDAIRRGKPTTWEALYMQRPTPKSGGMFHRDWWQFYANGTEPRRFDELIGSWDLAFKGGSENDYVAGQVWGRLGPSFYLLDLEREHLDFGATVKSIRAQLHRWPSMQRILIEDKANGPAVVDTLRHEIPRIVAVNPQGGKEARANAVSGLVEGGTVFLPAQAIREGVAITSPTVDAFISETASFPLGQYDDQVDAMSQALISLTTRPRIMVPNAPSWLGAPE